MASAASGSLDGDPSPPARRPWLGRAIAIALALLVVGSGVTWYARGTERRVVALRAADGRYAWSRGAAYSLPVGVAGDRAVVIEGHDSRHVALAAYDARTGRRLWSRASGDPLPSDAGGAYLQGDQFVVTGTSVYLAAPTPTEDEQQLLNLDIATGERRWAVPYGWDGIGPLGVAEADGAAFIIGDGGPAGRHIERRAAPDGRLVWARDLRLRGTGTSTAPQVAATRDLLAFAAGPDVIALDAATGADRYTTPTADGANGSSIWQLLIAGDTLYAVNHDVLLALDVVAGAARWRRTTTDAGCGEDHGRFRAAAVDAGRRDLVILCGQLRLSSQSPSGSIVALDPASGQTRWRRPVTGSDLGVFRQIPALAPGRAIVAETLGTPDHLTALDPATGAVAWSLPTDDSVEYRGYRAAGDRVIVSIRAPRWRWWRWRLAALLPG